MTRTSRQTLGAAGEQVARRQLEQQGYIFVTANWRCPSGELDLVMRDNATLVFVEVKTRHGERLGAAEEAISAAQARRLLIAAETFLEGRPELARLLWRFDLVAVTLDSTGAIARMTHIEDAVRAD